MRATEWFSHMSTPCTVLQVDRFMSWGARTCASLADDATQDMLWCVGCASSKVPGALRQALANGIACPLHCHRRPALHACAGLPTLWIAEGLFYYLEMDVCTRLLQGMAALAAPGSALIMTHLSLAFYNASQKALQVVFNAPVPAI